MDSINIKWLVKDVSLISADTAIAGLPGIGHVGKLVVDHLIQILHGKKIADLTSTFFPPQMYIGENGVLRFPRNEFYYIPKRKKNPAIILLTGDCQSIAGPGHYKLAEAYVKVFTMLGVKRVYTLGGYGTGHLIETPRVLAGLSSPSLKEDVEKAGAVANGVEPIGGIIGACGLIITFSHLASMEGIALLGETSGYLVDPVSSTAVLDVLEKLIKFKVDRTDLLKLAKEMQSELSSITSTVQQTSADDLRYIG
ncbi:MAG TPA: proteasome assembly chaperone family protein [Methanocorpusculum sp.]|nr:proteasome assembly chaperone family protein [Methanocorpusculum sp.]